MPGGLDIVDLIPAQKAMERRVLIHKEQAAQSQPQHPAARHTPANVAILWLGLVSTHRASERKPVDSIRCTAFPQRKLEKISSSVEVQARPGSPTLALLRYW